MPTLTEEIRPPLLRAIQSMVNQRVLWREQPRQHAGGAGQFVGQGFPGDAPQVRTTTQGIQCTIQIQSVATVGVDRAALVEDTSFASGLASVTRGTRLVAINFRAWSFSQQDQSHAHGVADRLRTALEGGATTPELIELDRQGIVFERLTPAVQITAPREGRRETIVTFDIFFRVPASENRREGFCIEQIDLVEGLIAGGARENLVEAGPIRFDGVPPRVLWRPGEARRPVLWWAAGDGLEDGLWVDRIHSWRLEARGGATVEGGGIQTPDDADLITVLSAPHLSSESVYLWAYVEATTPSDGDAIMSFWFDDGDGWNISLVEDSGDIRVALQAGDASAPSSPTGGPVAPGEPLLVGVYVTGTAARLDVNGARGPVLSRGIPGARSRLQLGAFGGTTMGRSAMRFYDSGMVRGQDVRSLLWGYVRAQYRG